MDAREFLRVPVDDVVGSLTLDEKVNVAGPPTPVTCSDPRKDQPPVRPRLVEHDTHRKT